ncbi:hypothetical protein DID80_07445 [Candidatus Marinamargulisbacteria bacterium SCGC AAA071-K20]|nr:hypothetical protein DID80_07445 [Candidatus Marinamargulisbacteria bacterium SCGC AAA071-K20]
MKILNKIISLNNNNYQILNENMETLKNPATTRAMLDESFNGSGAGLNIYIRPDGLIRGIGNQSPVPTEDYSGEYHNITLGVTWSGPIKQPAHCSKLSDEGNDRLFKTVKNYNISLGVGKSNT